MQGKKKPSLTFMDDVAFANRKNAEAEGFQCAALIVGY